MFTSPDKGYLTVGVTTQFAWPAKERVVVFREREFQLLPGSDTLSPMIQVKTEPGFTQLDAYKLILELLSALAWAEQGGAETTSGSWGSVPINIGKGPTGMTGEGYFDYLPDPADTKAKLALALYREGLSVNLTPYQFLSFFKVINVICNRGPEQKQWIRDNLQHVTNGNALERVVSIMANEPDVADYLYNAGRCAVAHAFDEDNVVNPDDPADLLRLSEDLPLIRDLARVVIEREFEVKSARSFHDEHLYELEGFRAMFGNALVARLKAREDVPPRDLPIPSVLSFRLRDRDRLELFESMNASVVWVRNGCVRLRLESKCRGSEVFVGLNFAAESLTSEPADFPFPKEDRPESGKIRLQWIQFYRWWFGGNGVIELWDTTGRRLARSQDYMPPVNSRFPRDEVEKLEAELRARAGIPEPDREPRS